MLAWLLTLLVDGIRSCLSATLCLQKQDVECQSNYACFTRYPLSESKCHDLLSSMLCLWASVHFLTLTDYCV